MEKTTSILRNERIKRGLDQMTLGFYAKIPGQMISSYELGRMPCGPKRGHRLSRVLGMEYSQLFNPDGYARLVSEMH